MTGKVETKRETTYRFGAKPRYAMKDSINISHP